MRISVCNSVIARERRGHQSSMPIRSTWPLVIAILATGCYEQPSFHRPDSEVQPDSVVPDSGTQPDGTAMPDGTPMPDGPPMLDSAITPDAGLDSAVLPDTPPIPDAPPMSDGGVPPDAPPPLEECFVPGTHPTIAAALENTCPIIWIAAGTYSENVRIARDVTVRGQGAVFLDGRAAGRVITIASGTVTLEDLVLRHGRAVTGGGVRNHGALTLRRVRFENNVATLFGGGIYHDGESLVLEDTDVVDNRVTAQPGAATAGGGGIYSLGRSMTITAGTIASNRVEGADVAAFGAGIAQEWVLLQEIGEDGARVTIDGTVIDANAIAVTGAGSGRGGGAYLVGTDAWFGPVSTFTVMGSQITNNSIEADTAVGGGMIIVPANFTAARLEGVISDSLFENNQITATTSGAGGGMAVVPYALEYGLHDQFDISIGISRSRFINNTVSGGGQAFGGGLYTTLGRYNDASMAHADFQLTETTITDNSLDADRSSGGGIYANAYWAGESLHIYQSTISGNRSVGAAAAEGGGIGLVHIEVTSIIDSTISGNLARATSPTGESMGGALALRTELRSRIHVRSSTITTNSVEAANARGGGFYLSGYADVYYDFTWTFFANSIIANNTAAVAPDCLTEFTPTEPPYEYPYVGESLGYNLFGMMGECITAPHPEDRYNLDPLLLPLTDNGGPTLTHALGTTSPAIDTGNPNGCELEFDQRGEPRVNNGRCDIGSYEK